MSDEGESPRLPAEERARVLIDRQLGDAGWSVQSKRDMNLFATTGVAVRETVMKAGHGRADYLLHVDKRAVGVIEAKRRAPRSPGWSGSRRCMPRACPRTSAVGP
jgi:type I restriction enzyme R subunit